MRRLLGAGVLALALAVGSSAPVWAASRTGVAMDVVTTFDPSPDLFEATGIEGCDSGTVADGRGHVQFTPGPGIFGGFKVFTCDGSDSGFIVRLNARFGPGGSEGTWAIVDAWGALEGLRGSGSLFGEPIEEGIIDHYTGAVVG